MTVAVSPEPQLLGLAKSYSEGSVDWSRLLAYVRTIPPRGKPVAGSPDWFDGGPWSEWDDLSRAVNLGFLTKVEAEALQAEVAGKSKR